MLRVITVDDEPLARDCVRAALRREPELEIVAECADGEGAVQAIRRHQPDLVFLDVQMPGLDGFGVIEAVGAERMPAVVFVTAFEEHALRAFQVHAMAYVLKPFDDDGLRDAFRCARRRLNAEREGEFGERLRALLAEMGAVAAPEGAEAAVGGYATWITVARGADNEFVRVDDVDWFQADGNYVRLHVQGRTYLLRASLNGISGRLHPAKFARIHRSTVVNLSRIKSVQRWMGSDYLAILTTGDKLRVSRTYRDTLLAPIR